MALVGDDKVKGFYWNRRVVWDFPRLLLYWWMLKEWLFLVLWIKSFLLLTWSRVLDRGYADSVYWVYGVGGEVWTLYSSANFLPSSGVMYCWNSFLAWTPKVASINEKENSPSICRVWPADRRRLPQCTFSSSWRHLNERLPSGFANDSSRFLIASYLAIPHPLWSESACFGGSFWVCLSEQVITEILGLWNAKTLRERGSGSLESLKKVQILYFHSKG